MVNDTCLSWAISAGAKSPVSGQSQAQTLVFTPVFLPVIPPHQHQVLFDEVSDGVGYPGKGS